LLTVLAMRLVGAYNEAEASRAVDQSAVSLEREIVKRVGLYQYGLLGVRGAIVTLGEDNLTRQVFARYVASRNHAAEFPGAHGFGVVRRVSEAEQEAFVAKTRADGHPDFTIRQFAPQSGERFVIQFVEPEKDNLAAIGRDLASDPIRRDAALDALRSGRARLTAPFTPPDPGMEGRKSILLLLPLYRGSQHLDLQVLREDSGFGWVFARLIADEVFSGLTGEQPGVHFSIVDLGAEGEVGGLYSDMTAESTLTGLAGSVRDFDIFGRRWRLTLALDPIYLTHIRQISPKLAAAAGLIFTVLSVLGALLWARIRDRDRAAIEQRTRLAAIIDSANDGIIGQTLDGVVTSWNRAAESLFGFTALEAIGQPLMQLIMPRERWDEEARLLARVRDGIPTAHFETMRRHKDGRSLEVSVTVSPVWDDSGRVVGASKTVRDVSARKQAEAKILELNATLERQVAERTREIVRMAAWQSAILNNAGYAIIAVDEHWTITVFNPAAETLLGYRADEVIGQTPELFHDPEELAARQEERAREFGREFRTARDIFTATVGWTEEGSREWTYIRKDGRPVPVLVKVTLLRDQYGGVFGSIGIAIDLTERKRAVEELRQANAELRATEETLRASEIRFRSAFETAAQGMALVALDGRFLQVNAALCGMLGYDEDELLATDFQAITHPDDVTKNVSLIADLMENRADSYQMEKRYLHKDGRIIWALLSASVVRTAGGEPIQFVWQVLDITQKHEAEAVLIEARRQAEAADRAKSEFLANMSHEIRTPLNAILGLSHILGQTSLSDEQQDYTSKIETAGRSLLGILNDILDYSKIEANRLDLETIDFSLAAVLDDLAVIMSVNGRDLELELTITADKAIPHGLRGDPSRLQQVLINLTGNAIKFTRSGTVGVRAELVERLGDQVVVKFLVTDSGIGMSAETLTELFQPFSQADATTTRRFGGTGLGLAISKRLVEMMGGTIGVDSRLGEGSSFWFTIPFTESLQDQADAAAPPTLRLLIVDDSEAARQSLLETVDALGWTGEAVRSGAEAIERIGRAGDEAFDVLLIDWRMPDMDGLETSQRIKQPPRSSRVPVVLLVTGFGREEWQNERMKHLVDGVLVKPVTKTALASAVALATGLAGAVERKARGGPRLAGLRILVVEDNTLNQEVARTILQNEGAQVEVLGDGRQAVDYLRSGRDGVDIVLMDAQMPVMDGFEASTYVREVLQIHDLPILAVTAGVRAADKAKCLAAGMTDFVSKPLDVETLISVILRYVTPHPDAVPCAAPTQATAGEGPLLDDLAVSLGLDVKRLRAIAQDGDPTLLPLLHRLGASAQTLVAAARDHLAKKDRKAAARHVHTLRGSAANFGAAAMAALAGDIEAAIGDGRTAKQLAGRFGQLQAEADKFCAALAGLAADQAPVPKGSSQLDEARLDELLDLLRAKNFAALDLFGELASNLSDALEAERYLQLQSAIDALAFDRAVDVITLAKQTANL
jgi:PAS domain S-box-containing protein